MKIEICPPGTHSPYSRKKFHENQQVNEIVDLLFQTRNLFLRDIAILLTTCANVGGLRQSSRPIIKRWMLRLEQPGLVPLIKIIHNLDLIYRDTNKLNLKGAIVEVYMHKRMTKKYEPTDHVHFECNIKVDGWISSCEVDVGAIKQDCTTGECYECKLGTGALDRICLKQQLVNLKNIFFNSRGTIIPAVASFEDKRTVKFKVKNCSDYFPQLKICGRDELAT